MTSRREGREVSRRVKREVRRCCVNDGGNGTCRVSLVLVDDFSMVSIASLVLMLLTFSEVISETRPAVKYRRSANNEYFSGRFAVINSSCCLLSRADLPHLLVLHMESF